MMKFNADLEFFRAQTRRRVITELVVLCSLITYFYSSFSSWISNNFELIILLTYFLYVAFGWLYYQRTKLITSSFSIELLEDGFDFVMNGKIRNIKYSDVEILGVKRSRGKIVEIIINTAFKQKIRLKGFQNMDELYEGLLEAEKGVRL